MSRRAAVGLGRVGHHAQDARAGPSSASLQPHASRPPAAARREGRPVLGTTANALPPGVRNLHELLNEYVVIKERDSRRQQLQASGREKL